MSTAVRVVNQNQVQFSEDQVSVIKNQIAIGATDLELKSFIWQCQRTGLDPFARQIYFIKSNGKVQIQTSIDGFRVIAERSGVYEGQTSAQWCGPDGVWKDIWLAKEFPVAARIGVYKKGFRDPLYAVAHWNEYFAQPGFMHKKMPALMIAKVAESLALRKAFPNEMSGLYTQEEMNQTPAPKISPDQPGEDEGDPNAVHEYTPGFGQWSRFTLKEIAKNNAPDKISSYMDRLDGYVIEGKYPENHVKMKEFNARMSAFMADLESGKLEY